MTWTIPEPRWDTVAGTLLDAFFRAVRAELPDYEAPVTVFGSAPNVYHSFFGCALANPFSTIS